MGIQDYFRKQNIFGNPTAQAPFMPDKSVGDIFGSDAIRQPDESMDVGYEGDDTSATDAFKQSVLNPPQHQNPSWMRTAGTGILSALQGSNEPDPMEKTRRYVDGVAYQKQKYVTDPTTGEKKYIANEKPRGFWESLGNKPFNTEQAGQIMNMPNDQRLADWKIKTGGLKDAATLENKDEINRALAAQRLANASVIPQREARLGTEGAAKVDQGQQKIDLAKKQLAQNQQKLDHVMSREDLSETEKASLANRYKQEQIRLQGEINANLQETKGGQAIEQIDARGDVQKDIQELRGTQATEQIGDRGDEARKTAGVTGEEARKTKATAPGGAGSTSQIPTQQKVGLQLKANKAKQEHPEWSKYIKTDADGMVTISPPSSGGFFSSGPDKAVYDAITAYMNGEPAIPATTATPGAAPPKPAPKPNEPVEAGRVKVYDLTGKVVATIPQADVARLNKKKYTTTPPKL